jgi:hypothetical protein
VDNGEASLLAGTLAAPAPTEADSRIGLSARGSGLSLATLPPAYAPIRKRQSKRPAILV